MKESQKVSLKTIAINPFTRIAGWRAFGIGIVIVLVTVLVGAYGGVYFPGAFDLKVGAEQQFIRALYFQFIGLASVVGVYYLISLIFAKGTRFQDILGTITLSRYPYLIATLFMFFVPEINLHEIQSNFGTIMIIGLLTLVFIVWHFVLLFNAYRVSTGLSGVKGGVLFFAGALVAQFISTMILSKYIFNIEELLNM